MSAQTANLFLLEDLDDVGRTRKLPEGDLNALHAVADWIKAFVAEPHRDLGRAGPVCPYVPQALERKTLWLAPERISGRGIPDIVDLIDGYGKLLFDRQSSGSADPTYQSVVVVFTDLPEIVQRISSAGSQSSLRSHPMWKMDWSRGASTKATPGLRSTTPAFARSWRPYHSCS